mgnify:CR=1 FL=1
MEQTPNPGASHDAHPVGQPHFDPKDVQDNKVMAAISYLWILCFIPLLVKKDSKFVQEHAKQGTVLFIAWVIVTIVGTIIPFLGWMIILPIGNIIITVIAIVGIIKALMGEFWEIPVIGAYRSKINL